MKNKMQKNDFLKSKKHFTLIELLVVIAIIAIFGGHAASCSELSPGKSKSKQLYISAETDRSWFFQLYWRQPGLVSGCK